MITNWQLKTINWVWSFNQWWRRQRMARVVCVTVTDFHSYPALKLRHRALQSDVIALGGSSFPFHSWKRFFFFSRFGKAWESSSAFQLVPGSFREPWPKARADHFVPEEKVGIVFTALNIWNGMGSWERMGKRSMEEKDRQKGRKRERSKER